MPEANATFRGQPDISLTIVSPWDVIVINIILLLASGGFSSSTPPLPHSWPLIRAHNIDEACRHPRPRSSRHSNSDIHTTIQSLLSQQARLCRRVNALRAPIHALPVEVLTEIFELACAGMKTESFCLKKKLAISAVCNHWHDVIWFTAHLWANIDCGTFRRGADTPGLLDLYLTNARNSLLTFALPLNGRFGSDIVSQIMDRMLHRRAGNIHHFKLALIDESAWRLIIPHIAKSEFTNLHNLELSFTPKHSSFVDMQIMSQMPHLDAIVRQSTSTQAIRIKTRSPHLVDFSLTRDYDGPGGLAAVESLPALKLDEQITFSSLRKFTWRHSKQADDTSSLQYICLPFVRELYVELPIRHHFDNFKPLRASMTAIKVVECNLNSSTADALAFLPSAESLTISGGQTNYCTLSQLFERLTDRQHFLPQLTHLNVRANDLNFTHPAAGCCFDNLIAMLNVRTELRVSGANLEEMVLWAPAVNQLSWAMTDAHMIELQRLSKEGLAVVIGNNNDCVYWL
ncbi:hypothetical protein D9756_002836 [Leucocoprinus leucothites]|uniref:F-box domain-containing protein n=1 Tax=Leucocoprinus leucothites TaxID=201217 RepID=A0A8H5GBW3_9AGAR|nr:hypothetical protein D9756_002836 [Leucoagaricus leucothites]